MGKAAVLNRPVTSCSVAAAAAILFSGALLLSSFVLHGDRSLFCSLPSLQRSPSLADELHSALLHYATSSIVPQQSRSEISISFNILRRRSPCNFLVFGLGHDSPMWSAFNAGGTTVFLEEDPKWFQSVLRESPTLRAYNIRYPTKLSEANDLIRTYRSEPECLPPRAHLKGNKRCRLALADLPDEIYKTEWDLIMIDAPKGYFAEAPGRMGAIYSVALMARARRGEGVTDVFLHDVERNVEKTYAMEFLCKKYLVEGTGRLWHFQIPPTRGNETSSGEGKFC
ncbi:probable methyltransferase At1g27930 [Dendrobium catenatum]|uniref:Glucuronoxylan 4-O-methyltransferase 1 n=1 Tax=Dendrobium catenatum TaxID=906689 RepID=A0A2I0V9F4_9ASPA|nr:probable methyltransferase At1g27930 [Dendrobium catenatum]PKU60043.1 Glucuronoxylan 4-O-methyltransferase 1 [Dendrobium catenatum]